MFKNILTSIHGWAGILTVASLLSTQFAPLLPMIWQNWITATLALLTFYFGNKAVKVARAYGVKGL